jgi:hypothetical protein
VGSFEDGVVAQMVEQRTENPCVTGSIPVDATAKSKKSLEPVSVQGFFIFRYRTSPRKSLLILILLIYDAVTIIKSCRRQNPAFRY